MKVTNFKDVIQGKRPTIDISVGKGLAGRVASNRLKLESVIETVVLCGRQNILLRGHRDGIYDREKDTASNHVNVWAIIDYAVKRGDTVLWEHLHSPAGNAAYTSSNVQNQLINIIGAYIRDVICSVMHRSRYDVATGRPRRFH